MENILHEINKVPISHLELANRLDEFLVDNHDVYRQSLTNRQNETIKFSYLFTDDLIIHILYYDDRITNLFFALKDRVMYTELPVDNPIFYSMINKESFSSIKNTLKNHSTASGYFMHNNDLYEFVENVDIHWITKRASVKSSMISC